MGDELTLGNMNAISVEVIPAVDFVPDGMIKPYPPIPPTEIRKLYNNGRWKQHVLSAMILTLTLTIGMIIGYKWGDSSGENEDDANNRPKAPIDNYESEIFFGTQWIPYGDRLVADKENLELGGSTDINGDASVLAMGAPDHNDKTGIVIVMKYIPTSGWTKMGDSINGPFNLSRLGSSVQLSRDGEILVVGAMGSISSVGEVYGQVRGYRYNSYTDIWVQIGDPIQGDYKADRFGISLSMASDGRSWIVGADNARKDEERRVQDGYAKVYELSNGEWIQKGKTIEGANGSRSGHGVAMSGDGQTVCVGDEFYELTPNFQPGRARCLKWSNGREDWGPIGGDILGEFHKERNGYGLALNEDGTVLAVSAAKYDSGSIRVYTLVNGLWKMRGEKITGENPRDLMGYQVSLSKKGDVLAYSACGYDLPSMINVGVVRVKRWIDGRWETLGVDIPGYGAQDHFGESLALNDDGTILVSSAAATSEYVNAFVLV